MKALLAALLSACLLAPLADAVTKAEADKAVEDFIVAKGFTSFDTDVVDNPGSAYLARFPTPTGPLRADAMVGPLEKALLFVETLEKPGPDRVRYVVSYGHVDEQADGQADTIVLVEVRRYNLGPLIHKETQESYGPENTADISAFGVGPDVAWRFAFSSVMGNVALPLSASRRVIADGAAQMKVDASEQCLSGPCRDIAADANSFEPIPNPKFEPLPVPKLDPPAYTTTIKQGDWALVTTPYVARVMEALTELRNPTLHGDWAIPPTPLVKVPGEPFFMLQIDQNLGQDIFSIALAVRTMPEQNNKLWVRSMFHEDGMGGPEWLHEPLK